MLKIIKKPWGFEEIWADVDMKYLGKYLHIKAGQSLSKQYHKHKDETVMCIEGEVWIEYGDFPPQRMEYYQPIHLTPGTVHRMYCTDKSGVILEVSTHYPLDTVRLSDQYGRVDS